MFGIGLVGVIQNDSFRCAVSTAPEGFFKGYSTVIQTFEGEWVSQRNRRIVAKAMLRSKLSRRQRAEIHGASLTHLDILGGRWINLRDAIDEVFSEAKKRNLIVDFLNEARFSASSDTSDFSGTAEALDHIIERN